jgi:thioredoxin 2
MVLRDGEVVARQSGAAPANVLRGWLDQALASPRSPAQEAKT